MNLGGPVWHASVAPLSLRLSREMLRRYAMEALSGVGDGTREWEEWTGYAYHVRRRLTPAEDARVGPVMDIRGTPEARSRMERIRRIVGWMPDEEKPLIDTSS